MRNSFFLVVSVLAMLAFIFSSCCKSEKPAVEEIRTDQPKADHPVSIEKVKIRWFVGLGTGTEPAQIEIQQAVTDAFNARQENIELILEVVPYASARDTLSTQFADGNAPDIIGPVGIGVSNFFYGQWLDLAPLIKATNFDTSVFKNSLVQIYQTEEGQIGLPFAVFPTALFYQKFMFDEAGLNYPPANIGDPYIWPDGSEAKWSWETLTNVAKRLTVDTNGHTSLDEDFDPDNIIQVGYHPQWSGPLVVATFFEPGVPFNGTENAYSVNLPDAWIDAWRWEFEGRFGPAPFMANGFLEGSPEFGSGNVFNAQKAAIAQTQLWYTCCIGNAGDQWDLAALPSNNGAINSRMDAYTFHIWKNTPNPDAAFKVLSYLIGPEGVRPLCLGDENSPGGAYDAFPALSNLQGQFIEAKSAQYPFVENWGVFLQGLDYPDNPSAEAWMPNMVEAWARIETFANLYRNDGTIDFDAEVDTLISELEVIYNK